MPLLDEIDEAARTCGAVNTVKVCNGRLTGYITDGLGMMRALEEHGVATRGVHAMILGGGGAARVAGYEFLARGGRVTFAVRDVSKGRRLRGELARCPMPMSAAIFSSIARRWACIRTRMPAPLLRTPLRAAARCLTPCITPGRHDCWLMHGKRVSRQSKGLACCFTRRLRPSASGWADRWRLARCRVKCTPSCFPVCDAAERTWALQGFTRFLKRRVEYEYLA